MAKLLWRFSDVGAGFAQVVSVPDAEPLGSVNEVTKGWVAVASSGKRLGTRKRRKDAGALVASAAAGGGRIQRKKTYRGVGSPCTELKGKAKKACNERISACIREKRDEGIKQSQAVGMCVSMEREGRLRAGGKYIPTGSRRR